MALKDQIYVGAKFGRWTVLEVGLKNPKSKAKNPPIVALCECECGTQRYKEYRDLYSGRSTSCGCRTKERIIKYNEEKGKIELNTRFGSLIVIEDLGYRKCLSRDKNERWSLCQCDCGNKIEVRNNNLKSGAQISCGCIKSYGERIIADILRKNNINFAQQYTFLDLRSENGRLLRFDFAIFDEEGKLYELIEFDGRQHFYGPEGNWSNSDSLESIRARDELKNNYCKENSIKLIRIPYYEISKISLEKLDLIKRE